MNKSIGHDNIPAFPLKIAALSLHLICNAFSTFRLAEAYFLKTVLLAEVIPILKKAARMIQTITGPFPS